MLVDIYKKSRVVDPNTGQIKYSWSFDKAIEAQISPFVSTSFKTQPTSESFREEYDKTVYLKLKTTVNIGRSVRVTNIRNADTGQVIYVEVELAGSPATNFNAEGSSPLLDPFGKIIQYDTLLVRASDQSDLVV